MFEGHRVLLAASLLAGSLALTGCKKTPLRGEWTRSDPFDGGSYPGEHTRSDLKEPMTPSGTLGPDRDLGKDTRQRMGQNIGLGAGPDSGDPAAGGPPSDGQD